MKNLLIGAIIAVSALFVQPTYAAKNVWRQCGIGGMIFTKTGWAAITSNIIWDLGTTATSSAVSSDSLCEGSASNTAKFINESYANLEQEIAVGQGTHLNAMLNMLGCNQQSHGQIINGLRSDLNNQMSNPDYSSRKQVENAELLYNSTMDRASSAQCNAI